MKEPIKRFRKTLVGGRRRLIFTAVAVVAALVAIIWATTRKTAPEPPPQIAFPLEIIEGEPGFVTAARADATTPVIKWLFVSADGRWAGFFAHRGRAHRYYFDVERRRFVAALPFRDKNDDTIRFWPGRSSWTPESIVIGRHEQHPAPLAGWRVVHNIFPPSFASDVAYYEVNAPERRTRLLAYCKHRRSRQGSDVGVLNRKRTRFLYWVCMGSSLLSVSGFEQIELRIRDLDSGQERVIPQEAFPGLRSPWLLNDWGWLPNDRTLAFYTDNNMPSFSTIDSYRVENIYLVDTVEDKPPQAFPVLAQLKGGLLRRIFDAKNSQGFKPGEDDPAFVAIMAFLERPLRARLAVTFHSRRAPDDPWQDKSSIWDYNLESRTLARVMDLPWGVARRNAVFASPSGNAFLTEPTSATVQGGGVNPLVQPVLYRIGQPPKLLPIQVNSWPPPERLFMGDVQFLTDDTLIYLRPGCEIWRFDLRTWKSELMWRPKATGGANGK